MNENNQNKNNSNEFYLICFGNKKSTTWKIKMPTKMYRKIGDD